MTSASRTACGRLSRRDALADAAIGLAVAAASRPGAACALSLDAASLAGPLGDLWIGSPQAKVTLVEDAVVTGTHCAAFHERTWPVLKERWIDTGKARFALRGFLLNPLDTAAFMLARAEGSRRYHAITDLLFETQASRGPRRRWVCRARRRCT